MNIGDMLVSRYGYNCSLVNFYKVVGLSKSSVWLLKHDEQFVSDDGYGQVGEVVPTKYAITDKPIVKRLKHSDYNNEDYVKISNYEYAYPWNGKPVHYDSMD